MAASRSSVPRLNFGKKLLLLAGSLVWVLVHAQSLAPLEFEVASVKPHPLPVGVFMRRPWSPAIQCPAGFLHCGITGNRFDDEAASLKDLIVDAYGVQTIQISGLPTWADSGHDLYDIHAKVAGGHVPTLGQVRSMLQTLLADRFQLKIHRETRELPVYALTRTKKPPKLVPRQKRCIPHGAAKGARGRAEPEIDDPDAFEWSWAAELEMLTAFADRPVIDKSGLVGPSYCTVDGKDPLQAIELALGPGGGRDPDGPSVFTVSEETWGLKLEPQKAPVDILVIDRAERPSLN